ncbi:MAG: hypothetical protein COB16_00745 [Rhodobacteraceae bacterium]|nr:MAG: hypothetical protein COB16_00745 [Paracoccaceae bacterium]
MSISFVTGDPVSPIMLVKRRIRRVPSPQYKKIGNFHFVKTCEPIKNICGITPQSLRVPYPPGQEGRKDRLNI